ncbi:carboxyltransferase domain-containing protein [Herbidospora sp. NBRC 101105]|uniref:5-oxoprolinase subunit B family protein n=1 Tax=Herbidospora sp. NBRC 101105 TaxID=3032195 RepID=UPI0024A0EA3D|nr:carboxyltransferase domain-containing protein [Herbidospora sp. NBRC 101105]GLX94616.1 allophanate hydrolase [Herbidospora sp. NBRC 101105]
MIRRVGEHALLVETGSLAASHRLDARLRLLTDVEEIVPGPETVLVVGGRADQLIPLIEQLDHAPMPDAGGETVEIPVVYDGADLADVAALAGISADEVIARHTASEFVAGWLGFAPGFAYLVGLDPTLHVSRLDRPRTAVPAGAVAIAGAYSAVYPAASPGGWRLLGHTTLSVWDVTSDSPALLTPGTRVRMVAT